MARTFATFRHSGNFFRTFIMQKEVMQSQTKFVPTPFGVFRWVSPSHICNASLPYAILRYTHIYRPRAQVTRSKWHMMHYGSRTPKPHYCYSNSNASDKLYKGPGTKRKFEEQVVEKIQTCEIYQNKEGKTCFKGTAALTKTEILSLKSFKLMLLIYYEYFNSIACLKAYVRTWPFQI